jgi:hypothetical protein
MGRKLGTDMVAIIRMAREVPLEKQYAFSGIMYIKGRHSIPRTFKDVLKVSKIAVWLRKF